MGAEDLEPLEWALLTTLRSIGARADRPHRRVTATLERILGRRVPWLDDLLRQPHWERCERPEIQAFAALVRLTQPFRARYPLIEGRGNFGSIDGDPPADPAFSECRLTPIGEAALDGVVSPLLLNGGARYLPHNLRELAAAGDGPLPGPDFPTGGIIPHRAEVDAIYREGAGPLTLRGRAEILRDRVVITEIPWRVRRSLLLAEIARVGVADVWDESSRDALRIVVVARAAPSRLLEQLLAQTSLEITLDVEAPGRLPLAQLRARLRSEDALRRLAERHGDERRTTIA
jgi:DNA gyrase subunit A